ncbi:MAG: chromate resistance protein [Nitrospirae bacterium]|nr:chromate resistance protein [Nitrospirota bacterium]
MSYIEHKPSGTGWLLFFYSAPSKPVSSRMKIWRRLIKAGSLPFKGAAYILPYSEEHYEFCQWLVSEVDAVGGEAAFIGAGKIETMKDREIIDLFNKQREKDYHDIEKRSEAIEIKIQSIKKGSGRHAKKTAEAFNKLLKEFEAVRKIDFFSSKTGAIFKKKLDTLRAELAGIDASYTSIPSRAITPKRAADYQGRIWITRKRPFIDRMASAWLIKKFIDKNAVFRFADEKEIGQPGKKTVAFDVMGGEFTHIGDLCTFEVIAKAFTLNEKKIKKIAAIVHELDIKDDKYKAPEAKGIEEVLTGIRKTALNDADALEKGMTIFEMLYESKA